MVYAIREFLSTLTSTINIENRNAEEWTNDLHTNAFSMQRPHFYACLVCWKSGGFWQQANQFKIQIQKWFIETHSHIQQRYIRFLYNSKHSLEIVPVGTPRDNSATVVPYVPLRQTSKLGKLSKPFGTISKARLSSNRMIGPNVLLLFEDSSYLNYVQEISEPATKWIIFSAGVQSI